MADLNDLKFEFAPNGMTTQLFNWYAKEFIKATTAQIKEFFALTRKLRGWRSGTCSAPPAT